MKEILELQLNKIAEFEFHLQILTSILVEKGLINHEDFTKKAQEYVAKSRAESERRKNPINVGLRESRILQVESNGANSE